MPISRVFTTSLSAIDLADEFNKLEERAKQAQHDLAVMSAAIHLQSSFIIEAKLTRSNDSKHAPEPIPEFIAPVQFLGPIKFERIQATPIIVVNKPPRLVEGFVWLVLPRKLREAIMGDAAEAYTQTIQRYNGRRWMATLDYIKEAGFATFAAFRMSLAQWVQLIWKRSS